MDSYKFIIIILIGLSIYFYFDKDKIEIKEIVTDTIVIHDTIFREKMFDKKNIVVKKQQKPFKPYVTIPDSTINFSGNYYKSTITDSTINYKLQVDVYSVGLIDSIRYKIELRIDTVKIQKTIKLVEIEKDGYLDLTGEIVLFGLAIILGGL